MELYETVKSLRKQLGFTQKMVSENILSESSYSRFERGLQGLSLTELEQVLERMGLQFNDINDLKQASNIHIAYIRKQMPLAFNNELSEEELYNLYLYAKNYQYENLMIQRYYFYIRQHFHSKCPKIPELLSEDFDYVFTIISNSKKLSSVYLQFIIDFTVHFTDKQLATIIKILTSTEVAWGTALDSTANRLVTSAYSNIVDTLIDRAILLNQPNYLNQIPYLLEKFKESLTVYYSSDFNMLYTYSSLRYNYYSATEEEGRENVIKEIKKYLHSLQEHQGNTAIKNPYAEAISTSLNHLIKYGIPKNSPYYIIN